MNLNPITALLLNDVSVQINQSTNAVVYLHALLIRHFINITFVIPGLIRNPARINIGAPCAPLDTGLVVTPEGGNPGRHDGATFYMPDQKYINC